jgi:methylated-DNA-[protein]-cysteine S-methyltransferase
MTAPPSTRFLLHPSPVGEVLIVTTEEGIVTLHPLRDPLENELERLSRVLRRIPDRSDDDPVAIDAARQLDEYFAGERRTFEVPIDLQLAHGFRRTVLDHLRDIAYGTTASYSAVAAASGSPAAVRAVGSACAHNPVPVVVPCHRVVRNDGTIGQYLGGAEAKQTLLALEAA